MRCHSHSHLRTAAQPFLPAKARRCHFSGVAPQHPTHCTIVLICPPPAAPIRSHIVPQGWQAMIDTTTQERIVVHAEGSGGPYIMVPLDQLQAVETILRDNGISHWTDTD